MYSNIQTDQLTDDPCMVLNNTNTVTNLNSNPGPTCGHKGRQIKRSMLTLLAKHFFFAVGGRKGGVIEF